MVDPDRLIRGHFAAYRQRVRDEVRSPGLEDLHRTLHRRQRARTAVLGTVAAVAVLMAVGQLATGIRRAPGSGPATGTSPSRVQAGSSPPVGPSPAGSSPGPSSARSPQPPPGAGSDLRLSTGPGPVTLRPEGGSYRGTISIGVHNGGRQPHARTEVYVTLPVGVELDFSSGDPGFDHCVFLPPPETLRCSGEVIPAAGGERTYTIAVKANFAPQKTRTDLGDFVLRVEGAKNDGTEYPDATPADNTATVRLVLAPA
jgi:hypothetical protein